MDSVMQTSTTAAPVYSEESHLTMTPAAHNGPVNASQPQIDGPLLRSLIKKQVEYYFSRENLNHDTYLVSQMDSDQYVDISIIANFNQVKKLTSDISLLVDALRDSVCVQVDETGLKVRPLTKRSMIILREVPEDTTKEEIAEMLNHNDCPPFVSCEYATGNCWYIEFDSEEHTKEAFHYLRETVKKFKGDDIKARIKAKPSTNNTPSSRQEQSRPEIPLATTADAMRGPPPPLPQSTVPPVRYQMPHYPLQNAAFPFPMAATQVQYTAPYPYLVQSIVPPWNGMFPDAGSYPYDLSPGYPYPQMPNQPRPNSQNQGPNMRDWKSHNRANANGISDRSHEPVHTVVSQSASTNTAPKNSAASVHHNGRSNSDNSNYQKPHGSAGHRNRPYTEGHPAPERNYNGSGDVPPRFRSRINQKEKRTSGGNNNHSGNLTYASSGHTRRSVNHQSNPRANNSAGTNSSANGVASLPHHSKSSATSNISGHDNRVVEKSGKDYPNNRQSNTSLPHAHNRNHGAHAHRNSKSPDKDVESNQAQDVIKTQSFELDSSAFPALPGATTAISPTAANAISPDGTSSGALTTTANGPVTQVTDSTGQGCEPATAAPVDADKGAKTESVSKLSDIVKNSIHELSKIADATKISKPSAHHKDSSEKSPHPSSTKSHGVSKNQGGQSYHKNRPTHLTNGIHPDKPVHNKGSGKVSKDTEREPSRAPEKQASTNKKDLTESGVADSKIPSGAQVSPSDSKISYAAIARANPTPPAPKTSPAQEPAPKSSPGQESSPVSPSSPSGDNNNNAESKAVPNSKSDNLFYATAAKNGAPNTPSTAHSPRKSTSSHSRSNGPLKPKNKDRQLPSSPTNRNSTSSHSSSVVAAR